MYTFRSVLKNGAINNISLGGSYLVVHKHSAPEYFALMEKEVKVDIYDSPESVDGFVRSAGGEAFPFYSCNKNYITEKGGTIEKL